MKPDEKELLLKLAEIQLHPSNAGIRPEPYALATDLAKTFGMHEKRAHYLLLKWADRGWWEYGVSARTGWLTEKGLDAAKTIK